MSINNSIAYCGTDCTECPAFIAKKANNYKLKVKTAKEWGDPEHPVKPEEISCDGCKTVDGEKYKFCINTCNVRVCAVKRNVDICSFCNEFPCNELKRFSEIIGENVVPKLEKFINKAEN
jgi:hypothetical protein